jgi:hypothetical protein
MKHNMVPLVFVTLVWILRQISIMLEGKLLFIIIVHNIGLVSTLSDEVKGFELQWSKI